MERHFPLHYFVYLSGVRVSGRKRHIAFLARFCLVIGNSGKQNGNDVFGASYRDEFFNFIIYPFAGARLGGANQDEFRGFL